MPRCRVLEAATVPGPAALLAGGTDVRWRVGGGSQPPGDESRSRTFPRKVDAERHVTMMESAKLQGAYVDPSAGRVTVAAYAEQWAASRVHRESSAERLEVYLRKHVLPHLGARPIGQLRHSEIQAWVKRLGETMAPGTVENVYRALSGLMRAAVRDRIVTSNPCEDVELPRKPKVEIAPPNVEEVAALLDAMPARYRILGMLAAGAGLRQGEALGLTVDRIDFLRRTLRVDRQLVTISGQVPRFGPPKSDASVRTVPLADVVLEALSAHLAAFPPGPDGLVVTHEGGSPIRRNASGHMWRRGPQKIAGACLVHEGDHERTDDCRLMGTFRYHDLRHHFASLLIAAGCSVKVVQKALGHSSAKQTLDTYAHMWPESDDLTRAAIDAAMRPPKPATGPPERLPSAAAQR